jgi:hypothetical protein
MRTPIVPLVVALGLLAGPASATDARFGSFSLDNPVIALMQDEDDAYDDDVDDEDDDADADDLYDDDEAAAKPADDEAVTPQGGAQVGESVGGAVGFERSLGFYTVSDLGGFIRFGGYADGDGCGFRCEPRITSNLQPWINLGVGYDILEFLAVQASFGTGFVANAAPVQLAADSPRDYGITFINLAVVANVYFDRFGVSAKLFGGGSLLTPPPLPDAPIFGGNVGGGIGVRWATLLPDVTIGMDVNGFAVIGTDGGNVMVIPGLSFAPVIKYVF